MQRCVIKMIRVTERLGNKCRFKRLQLYNIAKWKLCSPVVVVHKLQKGGKEMCINEQCCHEKKKCALAKVVFQQRISGKFLCLSGSGRRIKMCPVPLSWNMMQLPEMVKDGMVGKHQHLCRGTTQQFSIAWYFLISYTGFHYCCCCILTKMCKDISTSSITLQSTFAVEVQIHITKEGSCETNKSLYSTILRQRSFLSSLLWPLVIQTPLEQFITERDSIHIV